jgi:UDP-glucuronate 4-epimerase
MKNILITGSSGFVGQHLTKLLDVLNLPWIGFDLKQGQDIRNKHDLEVAFELNQVRYVIHLAARAGVRRSKLYPEEYISTNILGTQNVVDLCDKYNVEKLIFYSSSSVFGTGDVPPFKEESGKAPMSLYGISKLAGEQIVNNAKCPTVIVRPFTIYGEGGRKDEVIYRWLEQYKNGLPITVYGDGTSCRGYIYVEDLIFATVALLDKNFDKQHEDFNLGGSEVIYISDIEKVFRESFPDADFVRLDLPEEDVLTQYANTEKAKGIIGFNPEPNFINNVKKIIYEFKQSAIKN